MGRGGRAGGVTYPMKRRVTLLRGVRFISTVYAHAPGERLLIYFFVFLSTPRD